MHASVEILLLDLQLSLNRRSHPCGCRPPLPPPRLALTRTLRRSAVKAGSPQDLRVFRKGKMVISGELLWERGQAGQACDLEVRRRELRRRRQPGQNESHRNNAQALQTLS